MIAGQVGDRYAVPHMGNPLTVPATKHDLILLEKRLEQAMDKRFASAHRELFEQIKQHLAVVADNLGRANGRD